MLHIRELQYDFTLILLVPIKKIGKITNHLLYQKFSTEGTNTMLNRPILKLYIIAHTFNLIVLTMCCMARPQQLNFIDSLIKHLNKLSNKVINTKILLLTFKYKLSVNVIVIPLCF